MRELKSGATPRTFLCSKNGSAQGLLHHGGVTCLERKFSQILKDAVLEPQRSLGNVPMMSKEAGVQQRKLQTSAGKEAPIQVTDSNKSV